MPSWCCGPKLYHQALLLSKFPQVLNSYAKVFPTEPPSGHPVRDSSPQGPFWQPHVDEFDTSTPSDRLERKKSIGTMLSNDRFQYKREYIRHGCTLLCMHKPSLVSSSMHKFTSFRPVSAALSKAAGYRAIAKCSLAFVLSHVCQNAGEPAWNHSDSKRRLQLERLQAQALASSNPGASAKPGTWDYKRAKQERQQAIKSVLCPWACALQTCQPNTLGSLALICP